MTQDPGEISGDTGPSGLGLMENVVRFCGCLRENGLSVPLSACLDAVEGLPYIDPGELAALYTLLRANLVCRRADLERFRALFERFWLGSHRVRRTGAAAGPGGDGAILTPAGALGWPAAPRRGKAERTATYSPHPAYRDPGNEPLAFVESREMYEAIRRMLHPLAHRPSRRFRYGKRGERVSLRKVLHRNVQFGGDLIFLQFAERRLRKRRIVFLCDISGSMDAYTLLILQFVHALLRTVKRSELFFFSTELTRVTRLFAVEDFPAAMARLPSVVADWSGGTRIGHCLRSFREGLGGILLGQRPIVIIYSDGWDRGEIDVLEQQMARIKRKAHRVIWLNPLLSGRDYQPICRGMSAALPFVDLFLPVGGLQDLHRLSLSLGRLMD